MTTTETITTTTIAKKPVTRGYPVFMKKQPIRPLVHNLDLENISNIGLCHL
jgi:hypothetical protein